MWDVKAIWNNKRNCITCRMNGIINIIMELKILTLNCGTKKEANNYGRGSYVGGLNDFLAGLFASGYYDFLLLQEFNRHTSDELSSKLGNYKLLRMFDNEMNADSEVAIIYRSNFVLGESRFYSFASSKKWNLKWPGVLGFLLGKFQTPAGDLIIGSIHLNPLLHFITRQKQARFLKDRLREFNTHDLPVIFGGDFNSGLVGEKPLHKSILRPEFENVTETSGPTVDSRYIEPVVWQASLSVFLAKLGIGIRMKVDHIYADRKTAGENIVFCKVLGDRVSDHSAVEVVLTSVTTAR
jgi:endonuclease/exonuclease/phosphatase family metal-dependent hydrolase